ncbi:MAG TPA: DUF559 domain-containing protein [Naasia sp.]|jgi:hypothetical protein
MPRRPGELPEWAREAPFRVKDAQANGVGSERLRSPDLTAPFRGMRVIGPSGNGVLERCRAYSAIAAPGQFFSHTTAVRLHGLPLPGDERREPLHVTVFLPDRAPRLRGVTGHHASADSFRVVVLDGLWAVDAVTAIRQSADRLRVDDLVALIDAAISGRTPTCSLDDLWEEVRRRPRERGIAKLREALALARVGAESPKESQLRLILLRAGLAEPLLNADILDAEGRFLARGDLVFPEQRVIVEYDGEQHRTERRQYTRDVERLEDLAREGWRVVRILAPHLRRPDLIVRRVRAALLAVPPA